MGRGAGSPAEPSVNASVLVLAAFFSLAVRATEGLAGTLSEMAPSERQRTLERMRQVLSGGSALSQASLASFSVAFMEPSTCSASQTRGCSSSVSLAL